MAVTTSGSTDFNLTRNQIIELALRRVGKLEQGDSASGSMLTEAAILLNAIVKELQGRGARLWTVEKQTLTFVAANQVLGTDALNYRCIKTHVAGAANRPITGADYSTNWYQDGTAGVAWVTGTTYTSPGDFDVDAKTWGIERAWYRKSNTDWPLEIISREQYSLISDKWKSDPQPVYLLFERKLVPHIWLWPIPNDTAVVLHLDRIRRLEDFDAAADNADMWEAWVNMLAWGLAAELSDEYGLPLGERNRFSAIAGSKLANLIKGERDITSSSFVSPAYLPTGTFINRRRLSDSDDYGDLRRDVWK